MRYLGEFAENKPLIFGNEIVVSAYTHQTVTDEEGVESIQKIDLALTHEDMNFIFDEKKITIQLFIVYQGPEYPDPNPPPVEEKKTTKGKGKGGKNEPEEPEIPMIKPDPVSPQLSYKKIDLHQWGIWKRIVV